MLTNFGEPALLPDDIASSLPAVLADAGIAGGAVYDALVAVAAKHADLTLVTRDRRAAATYANLKASFELVVSAESTTLPPPD